MKIQNPTKLDIFFKGGGIIKFPVQNLKQIDIEPIDEQGGGGSSDQPTKLDTIKNYVNILYDHYNVEFDVIEDISTEELEVIDENEEPTGEVITATTKIYTFIPKTAVPKVYLNGNTSGEIRTHDDGSLDLRSTELTGHENCISKIIFNDTELTTQQAVNYDIIQVGTSNIEINAPDREVYTYEAYVESLDWIRNNAIEVAIIPILLRGEYREDESNTYREYNSPGFIKTKLVLNEGVSSYIQTVGDVLEQVL